MRLPPYLPGMASRAVQEFNPDYHKLTIRLEIPRYTGREKNRKLRFNRARALRRRWEFGVSALLAGIERVTGYPAHWSGDGRRHYLRCWKLKIVSFSIGPEPANHCKNGGIIDLVHSFVNEEFSDPLGIEVEVTPYDPRN